MGTLSIDPSVLSDLAKKGVVNFSGENDAVLSLSERFVESSLRLGASDHYKSFPSDCFEVVREAAGLGPEGVRRVLGAALHAAILKTLNGAQFELLPTRVRGHQIRQFARILDRTSMESEWLKIESDFFHKEYGLASLRLYAAAAQVVDPRCGLPRSTFLKSGIPGFLRGMNLLMHMGGFSPMFQIHTHSLYLDEFHEEGWNECYRCCADLYAIHPGVKGMFGGSWFYDPGVVEISPRLAYLQSIPIEGGAKAFFTALDGEHIQNAIATSPTRKKLYEEGQYHPKSFTLVWPRVRQINWATTRT